MGCKIGNREIKFNVKDDGEVCEVVHVFRPMTSTEEMELMREIAERDGMDPTAASEHYRTCAERWWNLLVVDVRGYDIAPAYDDQDWKKYISHEHKLEAISQNALKKAHIERPDRPSLTNSEPTEKTNAPEPSIASSLSKTPEPVTDADTPPWREAGE
ncbi:MAG: hypothetical protein WC551_11350 [Patescibacteria group bacterium]